MVLRPPAGSEARPYNNRAAKQNAHMKIRIFKDLRVRVTQILVDSIVLECHVSRMFILLLIEALSVLASHT